MFIGKIQGKNKNICTYRFPEPLFRINVPCYVPSKKIGIYNRNIKRLTKKSRIRIRKLNRATKKMVDMNICYITVRSRSTDMEIKLIDDERYIDVYSRWERIEEILCNTFKLPIQKL